MNYLLLQAPAETSNYMIAGYAVIFGVMLRYVISLLHLERKLSRQHQMLDKIATGIEKAQAQSVHFSTTHSNVIANLAGLYQETVSTLTPRIIVSGAQGHLTVTENAEQVRALLLAGIRAAILWRQCGGKRRKLLFSRKENGPEANPPLLV